MSEEEKNEESGGVAGITLALSEASDYDGDEGIRMGSKEILELNEDNFGNALEQYANWISNEYRGARIASDIIEKDLEEKMGIKRMLSLLPPEALTLSQAFVLRAFQIVGEKQKKSSTLPTKTSSLWRWSGAKWAPGIR